MHGVLLLLREGLRLLRLLPVLLLHLHLHLRGVLRVRRVLLVLLLRHVRLHLLRHGEARRPEARLRLRVLLRR